MAKCLHPDCATEAVSRGLCPGCFSTVSRLVKERRVTWEALEKSGKIGPSKRKKSEWFLEAAKGSPETP